MPLSKYRILDVDGDFEVFPNGHQNFLTNSARQKVKAELQEGREAPLATAGLFPTAAVRRKERSYRKRKNPDHLLDLPGQRLPGLPFRSSSQGPQREAPPPKNGTITEQEWAQGNVRMTEETDFSGASLPEVCTLTGDTKGIETFRLRALPGKSIDVWPGTSIRLEVDGGKCLFVIFLRLFSSLVPHTLSKFVTFLSVGHDNHQETTTSARSRCTWWTWFTGPTRTSTCWWTAEQRRRAGAGPRLRKTRTCGA